MKSKIEEYWVSQFLIGSIWINSAGYKVKILDYGDNDVWLLYLENQNKVGWNYEKFINDYSPCINKD